MKSFFYILIVFLRTLAKISILQSPVFRLTSRLPFSPERVDRLQTYVFPKGLLRRLKKAQASAARERFVAARNSVQLGQEQHRGFFIRVVVKVMRGMLFLKLGFIPKVLLKVLRSMHYSEEQISSLTKRIYGEDFVGEIPKPQGGVVRLSDLKPSVDHKALHATGLSSLAKHKKLYVFYDQGAFIPRAMSAPALENTEFVFYSFEDITGNLSFTDFADRSSYRPLRDQFNEISKEGEELTVYCNEMAEKFSDFILDQCSDFSVSEAQRDVIDLTLKTRMNASVSLANCYQQALSHIEEGAGILFLAAGNKYIVDSWEMFEPHLDRKNTFVIFSNNSASLENDFYEALAKSITPNSKAQSESEGAKWEELNSNLVVFEQHVDRTAQSFANNISAKSYQLPYTLMLHGETSFPYRKGVNAIADEMIKGAEADTLPHPVFLAISPTSSNNLKSYLKFKAQDDDYLAADVSVLNNQIQHYHLPKSDVRGLVQNLLNEFSRSLTHNGIPYGQNFKPVLEKFLRHDLLQNIALNKAGFHLSTTTDLKNVVASPTRNWMIRAIVSGILDGKKGKIPVLDAQVLNVIEHPKYAKPLATHAAVIDTKARDIYHSYLGFPKNRIILAGTPANDRLRSSIENVDIVGVQTDLSIQPGNRVITLISQLQPMERMKKIVLPLAELLEENPNTHIVIRMHPRENHDRRAAYKDIFAQITKSQNISFSHSETVEQILSVSNVCVTIYSNMAREAALVGKPVISVDFLDWQPPIKLHEEGISIRAASPTGLKKAINAILKGPKTTKTLQSLPYFKSNPHVLGQAASETIVSQLNGLEDSSMLKMKTRKKRISSKPKTRGKNLLKVSEKNVVLILAHSLKLEHVPAIFDMDKQVTVYTSDERTEPLFLPPETKIETGSYAADTARAFEKTVDEAGVFTEKFVDFALNYFEAMPNLQASLDSVRYGLWLRLRPKFISAMNSAANLEAGMQSGNGDVLVIASKSKEELLELGEKAASFNKTGRRILLARVISDYTFDISDIVTFKKDNPRLLSEDATADRVRPVSAAKLEPAQKEFRTWYSKLGKAFKPRKLSKSKILVTTDWKLKTVPPTLLPLIESRAGLGDGLTIANMTPQKRPLAVKQLKPFAKKVSMSSVKDIVSVVSVPSNRTLKTLRTDMLAGLQDQPFFTSATNELKAVTKSQAMSLVQVFLPECLSWVAYCEAFFKGRKAVSLACPGRQWHAEIAHHVADAKAGYSMTIQNAYMSRGYTYVKPTGQYISAIDDWSKGLFNESYDVPLDSIDVVSSPRFDNLKALRNINPQAKRSALKLSNEDFFVVFVAQVGFEAEAKKIVRSLAKLKSVGGRNIKVLVKLHPRSDISLVSEFNAVADASRKKHNVTVVADGRINDYMIASDVIITIYSNVGTEAAILEKNIIIAKLSDDDLPLPMDEFGFGYVAKSVSDMNAAVEKYITDESFQEAQKQRIAQYHALNPAMINGTSTQLISDAITAGFK